MSLAEIQKAIEELAPEEKEELREWLDGYDPAMEREWAAIAQERIRQSSPEKWLLLMASRC